jgi:hypothetical protein
LGKVLLELDAKSNAPSEIDSHAANLKGNDVYSNLALFSFCVMIRKSLVEQLDF